MRACLAALLLAAIPASAEQVIFSEVHYNPPTGQPEFIEIYNNTGTPFDIGTWYFSDGVEFTFPDFNPGDTGAHILKPFERLLVSDVDEATLRAAYSIPPETRVFGPYVGALDNGGETVSCNNNNCTVMTELSYDDPPLALAGSLPDDVTGLTRPVAALRFGRRCVDFAGHHC